MRGSQKRLNKHLTQKQIDFLKEKILGEIERIQNKSLAQRIQFGDAASSGDEVDSANDNIIKHSELRFATRETLYLKKLKKTLNVVDTEDYGMCEECGSPINFQRLSARPTSNMCISCKEESERDEYQNFHGRQSKSLGSTLNLAGV